jgi:hypothetical protein
MVDKNFIDNLANLYENIFHESAVESKELLIFAQEGNIHPLRIKVENFKDSNINSPILLNPDSTKQDRLKFINRMLSASELDTLITDYIETNV